MFNLLIKSEISEVVLLVDIDKGFQRVLGIFDSSATRSLTLAPVFLDSRIASRSPADLINCQAQPGGLRNCCRNG
jgi:hypothetical protein